MATFVCPACVQHAVQMTYTDDNASNLAKAKEASSSKPQREMASQTESGGVQHL